MCRHLAECRYGCGTHTRSLHTCACQQGEQAHTRACKRKEPKLQKPHFPALTSPGAQDAPSLLISVAGACKQIKETTSRRHRPQQTPTQNSRFPPAKHPHRALPHTGTHCHPNTPTRDYCSLCRLLHKHLSPNLRGVCSVYGDVTHMPRSCQPMCEPGSWSMADPGRAPYSDQRGIKVWIFPYAHGCMYTHTHRPTDVLLPQMTGPGCPWLPSSLTYPFFTV